MAPAAFGAHRCGNSRTNLIAPAAAVVVSGFVCLSCSSLHYCLTDSFLEECGPLKTTGEGWVLLNYENERISSNVELSGGNQQARTSCPQAELLKQQLRGIECIVNTLWPEKAARADGG